MSRKLISFDWAIKKILRSKANFGILEGFLSELLFTDIHILEVLESEANQDTGFDKYNRVDIKVKDSSEQILIIEIQYSRELDYLQRILFATSKTISEHLAEGAAYADVSKVISVNILYFDFGKGDDYIYHGTTRFTGLHNHSVLELSEEQKRLYKAEKIADIYPEYYLIEVRNFDDIARDSLDEWIYFLKNEQIKEGFSAKGLKQAQETLDVLKMSQQERLAYAHHQEQLHYEASMYESTYVLGEMKGMEKGIEQGIIITAKNMKQAGIPVTTISKVTGLSAAQIATL
ncbi:Rpn family recombination-promoting nuclease/putative transposase [Candidatus Venteria ishoeyi]|uniref:Rpn family recombination-promoting nuclease/putative transposase n=1 Tax=Candidatus Venteria ishoeyi TaxID=1899563 RepID=UPI0025A5F872|nr:Rpn family recombination-promoting nuclease/putative transposase [Candidatus Venteria ishoeyi]MDM8544932.1 Rpn family recombination-promoting nuclease/putative transposase [Candidatus Venteria ishoeyi]